MERKGQTSDNGQHNTLLIGHRPNIPGQTAPDSVTIEPELQTPSSEQKIVLRGGLCFLRFRKYSFAQNYYIFNCRKIVFNHIWSKSSPVFGGLYDVWSSKPTTTKSRKKVARLATHQFLSLRRVSPNFSWISWGFIAGNNHELLSSILGDICILYMREALPSGKSCLFAKMRIMASRISLSLMILKII